MVMPFSFSKSIESIRRSSDDSCWLARNVPDCLSRQSTSVVLPWSTCAIIAMFRMCCINFETEPDSLPCEMKRSSCVLEKLLHHQGTKPQRNFNLVSLCLGG